MTTGEAQAGSETEAFLARARVTVTRHSSVERYSTRQMAISCARNVCSNWLINRVHLLSDDVTSDHVTVTTPMT